MSILTEINSVLSILGVPSETGYFSGVPPNAYVVVTPMTDTFDLFADNMPQNETTEVRLSLFSKNNYISLKNQLVKALLQADFTITDKRYIGFELDTKFHHYSIDISKNYEIEEE